MDTFVSNVIYTHCGPVADRGDPRGTMPRSTQVFYTFSIPIIDGLSELSMGRMDPRVGSGRIGVGSGHNFAGFWRVVSGRVSTSDF